MATSNERLQMLMAAHYEFVRAADLPEGTRPYGVQTRLDTIEKQIMEELEKIQNPLQTYTSPEPTTKGYPASGDDDIPF